jgi:hypothetical protein
MGDRFVLLRTDSSTGRMASGEHAIRNTGSEAQMRKEMSDAVATLMANICIDTVTVTDDEIERLLKAADITTMARTAVEREFNGDVKFAHAPEMPTRFAKQLTQIVRGGVAIGMDREDAMRLAIRCARDSIPPMRLEILLDLASNPYSQVSDVRKRTSKPWTSTKRELEGLTMLGMVKCDEESIANDGGEEGSGTKTKWEYELDPGFDSTTLLAMAGKNPTANPDPSRQRVQRVEATTTKPPGGTKSPVHFGESGTKANRPKKKGAGRGPEKHHQKCQ